MKRLPIILLLLLLASFGYGLIHLFKLRFEAGDVYPEYSSLRADPLGTRALYESLENLIDADRNYSPLSKLGEGRQTALFYLGAQAPFTFDTQSDLRLTPDDFKSLETFVAEGGRLVISLFPVFQKPTTNRFAAFPPPGKSTTSSRGEKNSKSKASPRSRKPGSPDEDEEMGERATVSMRDRWGLTYSYDPLPKDDNGIYKPVLAAKMEGAPGLPDVLPCHTSLWFDNLTNSWRVLYAHKQNRPVLVERKFGAGSIVLAADSYLFSNQALSKERSSELLAWMVGANRRALFEETHLGVEISPGISALARKYRLHGLFVALILLAGLFVWKNSTSFMPPYKEERAGEGDWVTGKDSASGFVNLLRRNLPEREILAICLAEWKKACAAGTPKAKLERVQAIIDHANQQEAGQRNPLATYRTICSALATNVSALNPSEPARSSGTPVPDTAAGRKGAA